jgi:hypothetical protein
MAGNVPGEILRQQAPANVVIGTDLMADDHPQLLAFVEFGRVLRDRHRCTEYDA